MVDVTEQKLELKSVASLLAEPEPQQEWLIENIWVNKARGLIAGNPGVGKTWIALDMLVSVASGQPCFGKFPVRQGSVLLIEEEASEMNLARRAHALARGRGLKDTDLSNFYHLTRQGVKIPRDLKEIFWMMVEHEIKLVVFDSLRRFHSGEENSSTEMQEVLDAFGRMNILSGASIILIHHLAKAGDVSKKPLFERLRGSSDLWAWRDCLMGVEGEEDGAVADCSFQFRDAEAMAPIQIRRDVDDKSGAINLSVIDLEASEEFQERSSALLDYMQGQFGAVSRDQICTKAGGRKTENLRVFKIMAKRKMVVQNGSKWIVPNSSGTNGNEGNES